MLLSIAICCGESCGGNTPPPNPATPPTLLTPPMLPLGGGICFSMGLGTWKQTQWQEDTLVIRRNASMLMNSLHKQPC